MADWLFQANLKLIFINLKNEKGRVLKGDNFIVV